MKFTCNFRDCNEKARYRYETVKQGPVNRTTTYTWRCQKHRKKTKAVEIRIEMGDEK